MRHTVVLYCALLLYAYNGPQHYLQASGYKPSDDTINNYALAYEWVLVGCSITTLALLAHLIDQNIPEDKILWIADSFSMHIPTIITTNNRDAMNFLKQSDYLKTFYAIIEQYKNSKASSITPQQIIDFTVQQIRKSVPSTTLHIPFVSYNKLERLYRFNWYNNSVTTKHLVFASSDIPIPDFLQRSITNNSSFSHNDIIAVSGTHAECLEAINQLKTMPYKKIIALYTSHNEATTAMDEPNILFLERTLENLFAQLPLCTKTITCPSIQETGLPQFENIPFLPAPQDCIFAPGLYIINEELFIQQISQPTLTNIINKISLLTETIL